MVYHALYNPHARNGNCEKESRILQIMVPVDMGTDNKRMVIFRKSSGKQYAEPIGFLRGNLSRHKRLAKVICDNIICAAHPPGIMNVLSFGI